MAAATLRSIVVDLVGGELLAGTVRLATVSLFIAALTQHGCTTSVYTLSGISVGRGNRYPCCTLSRTRRLGHVP
jgi:hypothetical protein